MKKSSNKLAVIDSRFTKLISQFGYPAYKKETQYFKSLVRSIIYQQLSGKAASKIHSRFLSIYSTSSHPSPSQIKSTDMDILKGAGLSRQKINYIYNLCEYSLKNNIENIDQLSDNDISKELTQIKGIGQWTVDMFLMFTLSREDVFPLGDLGVKKGLMKFEKLPELPSEKEMDRLSKKWKPYRSIAAWYMWIIIEGPFEW